MLRNGEETNDNSDVNTELVQHPTHELFTKVKHKVTRAAGTISKIHKDHERQICAHLSLSAKKFLLILKYIIETLSQYVNRDF